MTLFETLENHLDTAKKDNVQLAAVAVTIKAIANACIDIAALVARGPLQQVRERACGRNADGDQQQDGKRLATGLQQLELGRQADGGEEHQQHQVADPHVKDNLQVGQHVDGGHNQAADETAGDRGWNIVVLKEVNSPGDIITEEPDKNTYNQNIKSTDLMYASFRHYLYPSVCHSDCCGAPSLT